MATLSPNPARDNVDLDSDVSFVLVVGDDSSRVEKIVQRLRVKDFRVSTAPSAETAIAVSHSIFPECIIVVDSVGNNSAEPVVKALRANKDFRLVPVVVTAASPSSEYASRLLGRGADDVVSYAATRVELTARVRAKATRPTVPSADRRLASDGVALSRSAFRSAVEREIARGTRRNRPCTVAVFDVCHGKEGQAELSLRQVRELSRKLFASVTSNSRVTDVFSRDENGRVLFLLPDTDARGAEIALRRRMRRIAEELVLTSAPNQSFRAIVGYSTLKPGAEAETLVLQAADALEGAGPDEGDDLKAFDALEESSGRGSRQGLLRDGDPEVMIVGSTQLKNELSERMLAVTRARSLRQVAAMSQEHPADAIVIQHERSQARLKEFLRDARSSETLRSVPILVVTDDRDPDKVAELFSCGADDVIASERGLDEISERVRAKISRGPLAEDDLLLSRSVQILTKRGFEEQVAIESARASRFGSTFVVAAFEVAEAENLNDAISKRGVQALLLQIAQQMNRQSRTSDLFAIEGHDRLWILLSDTPNQGAKTALLRRSRAVIETPFEVEGVGLRVTPVVGYEVGDGRLTPSELMARSAVAVDHASAYRDLQPSRYLPQMEVADAEKIRGRISAFYNRFRDPLQFIFTLLIGFFVPFWVYLGLGAVGVDVVPVLYLVIVISLVYTAAFIWIEGFLAHRRIDPPPASRPEGAATAIIAAYLPNEALTIESTLQAFFEMDYADLQVILAYNTPYDMDIETRFRELVGLHPNFIPLRVSGSTSKSQNVNTALSLATGEIIGVFDADSMPEPQSFSRAWQWLTNGVQVVQGHNAVRNGEASYAARTVAVEFEAIYAVNHPGRARLHGFGIFGGSNGYWQAETLRSIRMRGTMLTEDIDSSMRLVGEGGVIVSDPHLVAWELAPTTVKAIWNQRMRWSQGWFQVSLAHAASLIRSPKFNLQQKFGVFMMLIWREIYPWIAVQMFPLVAFMAVRAGGLDKIDWLVPIFLITTTFTLGIGPAESINAYILGAPELKKNTRWFWAYLLGGGFMHNEFLNAVARVAQLKEILKEKAWKVTPRQ